MVFKAGCSIWNARQPTCKAKPPASSSRPFKHEAETKSTQLKKQKKPWSEMKRGGKKNALTKTRKAQ
jgi:hypothetical protein